MKSLVGSKTLENLMKAFAGESQARNRYTFYSSVASKEGFKQIEEIFLETAENECSHGKRFYKLLLEGLKYELPTTVEFNTSYPIAQKTTLDNLIAAANGENEEHTKLYPSFAKIASEEGFFEAEAAFITISKIEIEHEKRFLKLAKNIEDDIVFAKGEVVLWKCRKCGLIHEGNEAPDICIGCFHPKGYFEILAQNY
jgi:rubrerythrin